MTWASEIGVARTPLVGGTVKRAFDLLFAGALLLLFMPLLLVVAVAVRATSRGPTIYRARRVGAGETVFEILKFRTMRVLPDGPSPAITEAQDSRITAVGWLLRTTKMDELPQLVNVIRGDMSIVGPRPEDESTMLRYYPARVRKELQRARPGMTGLLQVRVFPDMTNEIVPDGMDPQEFYNRDQLPRRVAVDLEYIRSWTLFMDLEVLGSTIWCLLVRAPRILLFGRPRVRYALPPVEDPELVMLFDAHARSRGGAIELPCV